MRIAHVIMGLIVALVVPAQARSVPAATHFVAASVQLDDGRLVALNAEAGFAGAVGKAWVTESPHALPTEISINCLEVAWYQPTYPIPPYLPFHVAHASGVAEDGTRYYITAFDFVPFLGFDDRLRLGTMSGEGNCGAAEWIGTPVATGQVVIGP